MISFSRFLKLSGIPILLEDLSPAEAVKIFRYYGANTIDPSSLRQTYFKLIKSHHPDKVGTDGEEASRDINAAYDVLKNVKSEVKDKILKDYVVWKFDGNSFSDSFSMKGSPESFPEMAKKMVNKGSCQAVFISDFTNSLYLIWSNGRGCEPRLVDHQINVRKMNDKSFLHKIKDIVSL